MKFKCRRALSGRNGYGSSRWFIVGTFDCIAESDEIDIAARMAELTPKQFQVLKQLQAGLLNKQIAYDLNITEATVKAHISAIFKKLEVNNRTQAVLIAEKLQIT